MAKSTIKLKSSRPIKSRPSQKTIKNQIFWNCLTQWPLLVSFVILIVAVFVYHYRSSTGNVSTFADVFEHVVPRRLNLFNCSEQLEKERQVFGDCIPWQCGRAVVDDLVNPEEAARLLKIAERGLTLGGGHGGASILELQSGALSFGDKFVNVYKLLEKESVNQRLLTSDDLALYHNVLQRVKQSLSSDFKIPLERLYLGNPTFFSRINNRSAVTPHDEYWHTHVDKVVYGYFHFTSLLYLTNFGSDFDGGRFVYLDSANRHVYVQPKIGRVSYFTSGSENTHFVEKVKNGTRFALTIAFTCDSKKGTLKLTIPNH